MDVCCEPEPAFNWDEFQEGETWTGWMPDAGVAHSRLAGAAERDNGRSSSSLSCGSCADSSDSFLLVDGVKVKEYKLFPEVTSDSSSEKTSTNGAASQGNSRVLILPGPNGSDIVVSMSSLSGHKDSETPCSCWCPQDSECRADSNVPEQLSPSLQPSSTSQSDRPQFLKYSFASMVAQRLPGAKEKIGDRSSSVALDSQRSHSLAKLLQGRDCFSSDWGSSRTTSCSSSSWDDSEDALSLVHGDAVLERDAEHFGCGNSFDRITWPYSNGLLKCQVDHSQEALPCTYRPYDSLSSLLSDAVSSDSRPSSTSSVQSSPLLTPTSASSVLDALDRSCCSRDISVDLPILGLPTFPLNAQASKSGLGSACQRIFANDQGLNLNLQNCFSNGKTPGEEDAEPGRGDDGFWKSRPHRSHLENGRSEPSLQEPLLQGPSSPDASPRTHNPPPPPVLPPRTPPAPPQQSRMRFMKLEPPPGFSVPSTTLAGIPPGFSSCPQAGDSVFSAADLVSNSASQQSALFSSPPKTARTQDRGAAASKAPQPLTRLPEHLPQGALLPLCCAQVKWIFDKPFDKCLPPAFRDAFLEFVDRGLKLWEVWKCVVSSPPSNQDLMYLARILLTKMTQDHKEAIPAQLEVVDLIFQRLSREPREV